MLLDSDFIEHVDSLRDLTGNDRIKRMNQIRNYARFCLSQKKCVNPSSWNAFTPEERFIIEEYNKRLLEAERAYRNLFPKDLQIGLFTNFYKNCEKLGSTLKPKKPIINNTTNILQLYDEQFV